MKHLIVFIVAFFVDSIWAYYIIYTAEKHALKSTILGALIMLSGAFLTLSYVEDKKYLISAIIGGGIGTYITVKRSKNENK